MPTAAEDKQPDATAFAAAALVSTSQCGATTPTTKRRTPPSCSIPTTQCTASTTATNSNGPIVVDVVTGTIVRRRVLGRTLAFVDVALDNNPDDDEDDDTSGQPALSGTIERQRKPVTIVQAIFQRHAMVLEPTTTTTTSFPVKNAALPYGARIRLTVLSPDNNNETEHSSFNHADTPTIAAKENGDDHPKNAAANNKNTNNKPLVVVDWQLLTNPFELAMMQAAMGGPVTPKPTTISTVQINNSNNNVSDKEDAQDARTQNERREASSSSGTLPVVERTNDTMNGGAGEEEDVVMDVGGGISYTRYLRTRGASYNVARQLQLLQIQQQQERPGVSPPSVAAAASDDSSRNNSKKNDNLCQRRRSSPCNNDRSLHGPKNPGAKALRFQILAQWLADHVLRLDGSDRILDVAGGKGGLSLALVQAPFRIPCTVVDLMARKTTLRQTTKSFNNNNMNNKNGNAINNDIDCTNASQENNANLQQQHNQPTSLLPQFLTRSFDESCRVTDRLVQDHTCLVGLHPDQCTEAILNMALRHGKSVVIIPCCVFPSLFPLRMLRGSNASINYDGERPDNYATNGTEKSLPIHTNERPVQSYSDFIQYLLQKDSRLRHTTLPFEGKNECIYLKVLPQQQQVSEI